MTAPKPLPEIEPCPKCKSTDVQIYINMVNQSYGRCFVCDYEGQKVYMPFEAAELWNREGR